MRQFNKRYWPHQVRFPDSHELAHHNVDKLERFCYDNFKTGDWNNVNRYFVFKRETDYAFFMLRWA